MIPNKIIEDEHVFLREITEADVECIRRWRNQTTIRKHFTNSTYIQKQDQQKWFQHYTQKPDDTMFIIEETSTFQKAIGTVAFYHLDPIQRRVEFGRLMIGHRPAQGKGLGKRAAILACTYAFDKLAVSEIYLYVFMHNTKAVQLYKDIGFVQQQEQENQIYMIVNKDAFLQR